MSTPDTEVLLLNPELMATSNTLTSANTKRNMLDDEDDHQGKSFNGTPERSQTTKKQKLSLSQEYQDKENGALKLDDTKLSTVQGGQAVPLSKQQYAIAERLARHLHEMEKKKQEEQKRQKTAEESWLKTVRRKVEEQRHKLEEEEKNSYKANQELYRLFNDLQGIAKDLSISFEYPEIVVVGMQSDGKSSFIEGLLGFQFNIVESSILESMINNPAQEQPSCRFRKEYPSAEGDPFEDHDTAVHELVDEIIKRTNDRAGTSNDKVSDVPIILRVEFAHCANLTIYDTPGFRLGGEEKLKNDIAKMVLKLIEPKHRIIVCLEQSTVEWANTTSRPIVRRIDPDLCRTILVNTKFDNRVKELRTKQAADTYLTGENLPLNAKPFFISMPVRRNLDSRYKDAIRDSFLDDYEKLLEINFDEKRFLPQIGMFKVKSYLEKLLNERYQQSLAPTLRALEELCKKTEAELAQVNKQLQQHDIEQLKNTASSYIQAFVNQIDNLLGGSIAGEPDKNGETLEEEKLNSGIAEWPDFLEFDIQNAKLKVYGGAQYSRLLNEFEYVAHSREFPSTTASEIASALGASKNGYTVPVFETAAANLVQMKAKQVFLPLIDIVLSRCSYIMKRLFFIAVHVIKHDRDQKGIGVLSVYEKFMNELRNTYENLIDKIEQDCRQRLKDDFVMFTKIVDWDLLSANADSASSFNFLEPTPEETKLRVQEIMERKPASWLNGERSLKMDDESYRRVALMAAKMYGGIRYFFAKYVRNKMNAFFLDPMLQEVGAATVNHFYKLPEKKYEVMFLDGITELKEHHVKLENQLQLVTQQRDKFKEMYYKMKKSSDSLYDQQ